MPGQLPPFQGVQPQQGALAPGYIEPAILPGQELPPIPLPPEMTGQAAFAPGQPAPAIDLEQMHIKVGKFNVKYATLRPSLNPGLPEVDRLASTAVDLGKTPEGFTAPDKAPEKVTIRLLEQKKVETYSGGALKTICEGLSKEMNRQGLFSVFTVIDPKDIDRNFNDLRGARTDLTILVYAFEIKQIRTVAKGPAFRSDQVINNPRYARIASHSPLTTSPDVGRGNLLQKEPLEEYISRLNRFPGRRVDAAVSSAGEPGELVLDYLVREDKPLFAYVQVSNTGTETTDEFQERVGVEYRQLAHLDDILSAEYVTSSFSHSNSVIASYQLTALFPDLLKFRVFGSYGEFTASDVGSDLLNFSGESWNAGLVATFSPFRWQGFNFDFFAGATWQNVSVSNQTFGLNGQTDFFLPVAGFSLGKATDRYAVAGTVQVETNVAEIAGTQAGQLEALGRFQTNKDFVIGKWDLKTSTYLEPLLSPAKWKTASAVETAALSHEVALSFRGQYTFGDRRLVPQFEEVVGGFNSVRGYPESIASADTVLIASAEYRYHVLHSIAAAARAKEDASVPNSKPPIGSSRFTIHPPTVFGRPWDLTLRAFTDVGQTFNNRILTSTEVDRTLIGAGIGIELAILRDAKSEHTGLDSFIHNLALTLRLDWGIALDPVETLTTNPVYIGNSRLHFAGTITY